MVAGLKFLSKKSFNPQNLVNQKSVWEREQESKREKDRHRRREKQLTIERDHEELARSREGASGGQRAALSFMYDAPPGLGKDKDKDKDKDAKHFKLSTKMSISDFEIKKLVGRGSFGEVWQVELKKTRQIYALKILKKKI
eukprot:953781_1